MKLSTIRELVLRSGCIRQLLVERLAIPEASPQELRPVGNTRNGIGRFREQPPQSRVMPTQLMARTVPVRPDSGPQPFDLRYEPVSIESRKIFIHTQSR